MAEIMSLFGNPLRDVNAVHFPVSSGEPVYPDTKSNVIINPNGSMEYGNADETVTTANKDVFTTNFKYKESDGSLVNASNIARTLQFIPTNAISVTVDGTYVTQLEILAWNASNAYVGAWDGSAWGTSEHWVSSADISAISKAYPAYKFKLNFKKNTITEAQVAKYLEWTYSAARIQAETLSGLEQVTAFDSAAITVIDETAVNGASGGVGADSNYVTTDFVDVSRRIGDVIEFNANIVANPIGFATYDRGHNYIDGLWGNKSDLADFGYVSDTTPQHIVWTLKPEVHYIRACMRKEYYTDPADFNVQFLMYKRTGDTNVNTNFITIAHKGYGNTVTPDTLPSFVNAAEAGFRAVEIDCRRTTDGVYVVSHNDTDTLYSGGVGASVTISSSTWADLKGKTFDSAGNFPICTVSQVFSTLKHYRMDYFVIDLKTGSNAEIMEIARRNGVINQIMLSYYSANSFLADLDMLKHYPMVAVRFTPSLTNEQFLTVKSAIGNVLFADINASEAGNTYYANSFSWQIPILCSGVTESTKNIMAPIATGAMSNLTLQYSPRDFIEMISLDFSQTPNLTASAQSASVSTGTTATITVTSSIDDPACYVYGYSDDLSVLSVSQTQYGANASFTLSKVSTGSANLIAFTATGEQIIIPVVVS